MDLILVELTPARERINDKVAAGNFLLVDEAFRIPNHAWVNVIKLSRCFVQLSKQTLGH